MFNLGMSRLYFQFNRFRPNFQFIKGRSIEYGIQYYASSPPTVDNIIIISIAPEFPITDNDTRHTDTRNYLFNTQTF